MENDRQQSHVMDVMEDSFNRASNTMDELFQDRFFPQRPQDTQYYSPFSSFPRGSLFFNPKSCFPWNLPFPVLEPLNFHDVFQPFYNMIHQAQQAMDAHLHRTPYHFPMVEFAGENNDRTVCKEISYNSTRCLWMKGQCTKCQEILEVDAAVPAAERVPAAGGEVQQAVRPAAPVLPAEDARHVGPAQAADRAVHLGVPAGPPHAEQRPVPSAGLHGRSEA
ncbi:clusterin-like isoform X2 [Ovis canadensis]